MPIYTRTGDKGETSLFGGKRVSKAAKRVEAYGTIDELNSCLGSALSFLPSSQKRLRSKLLKIQNNLLLLGSTLANPNSLPLSLEEEIKDLEKEIDLMTAQMPPLRNFILPGGSKAGSLLHLARTVCRRAERRLVNLAETESVDKGIVKYINRLSDFLFTAGRFVNHKKGEKETIWQK